MAGLVTGLTLVLSGCGDSDDGSSSEPSAAETWAADVCSTVGSWTTTVADARSTLSTPRDLSANDIDATFAEVRSATSTLMTDLDDLGAPDTDAGDAAEERLALLSEDLQSQADIIEDASDDQPQAMGDRLARVSTVSGALAAMASETQEAVTDIRTLDGAQELEDAFKSTASCQDLSR